MGKIVKTSIRKLCGRAVRRQRNRTNTVFSDEKGDELRRLRQAAGRGTQTFLALLLLIGAGLLAAGKLSNAGETGVPVAASPTSVKEYTVVIDAGHGGSDGGAVGARTGVAEAGLNLSVARMLREELASEGFNIIMTREDENAIGATKAADMKARGGIINASGVNLVVSVHMNEFTDPSVKGSMAYYMKGSDEGERLAQCVIDSVCDSTGQNRRLANPGDYYVIRECEAVAVLVECGFLSNAADEARLQEKDYQRLIAAGIAEGVKAYLETAGDS